MSPAPVLRAERPWSGQPRRHEEFPEIDGTSADVRRLKREMLCVARDPDVTVLITGESGTGKERVARAIHRVSPRASAPFVVIDCAGLSTTLAEDSLFGHVRGAFTGAFDERAGPFERADGGTVFLDEIGELPIELQMKLLRALQSRVVLRLGSTRETRFDARVIAATNVDLAEARNRGRFREDLHYRLSVYDIKVPPLRRRGADDIEAIVAAVLQRLAARRRIAAPRIDSAAMALLTRYAWPGNVRELENAIERMLVAAGGEPVLLAEHLPQHLTTCRLSCTPPSRPPTRGEIVAALKRNGFRRDRAAAALGLSRHQLYRLVRQYGLGPGDDNP